jgi:hypothetical protein
MAPRPVAPAHRVAGVGMLAAGWVVPVPLPGLRSAGPIEAAFGSGRESAPGLF